jgi:hypothetical protein
MATGRPRCDQDDRGGRRFFPEMQEG